MTLLQIILKELAGADGIRVLKVAVAPGTGTVHLVTKLVSYLQAMVGEDTNSAYTEPAHGVSSDSNSSKEERKPCTCKRKKFQHSKLQGSHGKQKKEKNNKLKNNMCPHCKKYHRKKPHCVKPDKCMCVCVFLASCYG
jgi:hypothetical protein